MGDACLAITRLLAGASSSHALRPMMDLSLLMAQSKTCCLSISRLTETCLIRHHVQQLLLRCLLRKTFCYCDNMLEHVIKAYCQSSSRQLMCWYSNTKARQAGYTQQQSQLEIFMHKITEGSTAGTCLTQEATQLVVPLMSVVYLNLRKFRPQPVET